MIIAPTESQFDKPIDIDFHCASCNYNLRTLLPSQPCPECGHPVNHSLQQQFLRYAAPKQLRTLRQANLQFLLTPIYIIILAISLLITNNFILPENAANLNLVASLVIWLIFANYTSNMFKLTRNKMLFTVPKAISLLRISSLSLLFFQFIFYIFLVLSSFGDFSQQTYTNVIFISKTILYIPTTTAFFLAHYALYACIEQLNFKPFHSNHHILASGNTFALSILTIGWTYIATFNLINTFFIQGTTFQTSTSHAFLTYSTCSSQSPLSSSHSPSSSCSSPSTSSPSNPG
ncbi:hypothetical protein JD969_12180 [Planctomycetota bacterium]|nr:hypothetical protein JD969_12180 [Planctomycetota bacterium]